MSLKFHITYNITLKLSQMITYCSFQSRIIEENWIKYIAYFTNPNHRKSEQYKDFIGLGKGKVVPDKKYTVSKLEYDNNRLSCVIEIGNSSFIKLAQIVDECELKKED